MSKSDNIKRAKLLRQQKKEREKQTLLNEQLHKDQQILRKKAEKENMKIIDRSLLGRKEKISTVLLEMIKPVLFEERKLLDEYIKIKCNQYGQYNDFVTDFQISFERDGKMNFTILTGITNEISKTLIN